MTIRLPSLFLSLCLLAQAGAAESVTDFPVELLGDLNGMSFPRTSGTSTGGLVKEVGNGFALIETKYTSSEKKAKKRFFRAIGQVLEIADESDFIQLARDLGYEIYSGKTTSRKIEITGFWNESGAPAINNAITRACNFTLGHLVAAESELDSYLALNWSGSFKLEITIAGISLLDVDLYIDRGDVTMLRGFLKAAEGALYLARSVDFSSIGWDSATVALEKLFGDCTAKGFLKAFDASAFAHLPIKSASDLQTARAKLLSAFDDLTAGDGLIKARTDGKKHLLPSAFGDLFEIVQTVVAHRDALITCLDQLRSPMDLASATVSVKPLEMTYTGTPLSPLIGTVTVGDVEVPYELTGTTNATAAGTYVMTFVGYGRSTGSQSVTWKIVIPPPTVRDDATAKVREDGEGGYVIAPSAGTESVEVMIPPGVEAAKVAVEVSPDVKRVTPNGAKLRVVRQVSGLGDVDITACLDIPAADLQGVVDLSKATVRDAIVKEALDTAKDAVIRLDAQEPALTTAKTRPGLRYTLVEGATLGDMVVGASKIGDGQPWTPTLKVKGGTSGFYAIRGNLETPFSRHLWLGSRSSAQPYNCKK